MEITRLEPTDAPRIAEVAALAALVRATDAPGGPPIVEDAFAAEIVHPEAGISARHFVGTVDGRIVGYLRIEVMDEENPQMAAGELLVHPDRRGRGHGTALLEFALGLCRAEHRAVLVLATFAAVEGGPERSQAGTKFLERHGFQVALDNVRRVCPVDAADPAAEQRLRDEALAASEPDYALRSWIGAVPDDLLASMCRMDAMVLEEIPLGDLDMAPQRVDPEKYRAKEAALAAHRKTAVNTVAVHRATGEVVAHTRVDVFDDPEARHAHLVITIVDPAHRGHRLGTLVKLENLRELREHLPRVKDIWTGNAVVNQHMIAINDRLGYRAVEAVRIWQRPVQGRDDSAHTSRP